MSEKEEVGIEDALQNAVPFKKTLLFIISFKKTQKVFSIRKWKQFDVRIGRDIQRYVSSSFFDSSGV